MLVMCKGHILKK